MQLLLRISCKCLNKTKGRNTIKGHLPHHRQKYRKLLAQKKHTTDTVVRPSNSEPLESPNNHNISKQVKNTYLEHSLQPKTKKKKLSQKAPPKPTKGRDTKPENQHEFLWKTTL